MKKKFRRARPGVVVGVVALALAMTLAACGSSSPNASKSSGPPTTGAAIRPMTIRFASFVGATSDLGKLETWFMQQVTSLTDGAVQFQPYFGGTLVGPTDMISALTTNQIQLGMVTVSYYPNQFALTDVTNIPFGSSNVPAESAAMLQLVQSPGPLQSEWTAAGLHPVGFAATPPSVLGSKKPITSLSDLKGLKVRGLDPYSGQVLSAAGADPVTIAIGNLYQALQTGVVSAYYGVPEDFVTLLKLNEVAPYIVSPGLGIFALNSISMSAHFWSSLQPALQKIITQVGNQFPSEAAQFFHQGDSTTCSALKAAGDHVSVLSSSVVSQWKAVVGSSVYNTWLAAAKAANPNASSFYQSFQSALKTQTAKFGNYTDDMVACANGSS